MISSISFQSPSSSTRDLCRFQKFGQVTTDKSRRSDRRSRYKISPIASCRRELIRRHLPNVHTPTDKDKEVLCLPIESRRISSSTNDASGMVAFESQCSRWSGPCAADAWDLAWDYSAGQNCCANELPRGDGGGSEWSCCF